MAENLASGPTLEQILWRAMDRYEERPGLVDAEEFAAHIFGIFEGDVPAEAWVERFFEGDKLHAAPKDVAEAIVKATRQRLHVYEFDLNRLEYVIIEDEEKVVVVSDFGQFALKNDDLVSRAIESAVVPARPASSSQPSAPAAPPRAVFVRSSGEVVTVDVRKVASALDQLMVKQVSLPAIDRPQARLSPVARVRRSQMSEAREVKALRQDARTLQPLVRRSEASAKPAAATALFVVMPDGTLARPSIGAASRWQQMVGRNPASSPAVPVTAQRFAVQGGKVVALSQPRESQEPGHLGARALAGAEALSAVRADSRPVRTLSDAALTQALERGAMVMPALSRAGDFWVQPAQAFKPPESAYVQQGRQQPVVAQPLQLGEITGDPWADWALTGGGEASVETMAALRGRTRHALRAALDRPDGAPEMSALPGLTSQLRGVGAQALQLRGAPVVGFRAPDGSVIVNRAASPIRLAAVGRVVLDSIDLDLPGAAPAPEALQMQELPFGLPGIAARSGALPETALSSLRFALERTAMASGYRLPIARLESAEDALQAGSAIALDAEDPRRFDVKLAGPVTARQGSSGQVAQLVLSMPFPNESELHVGSDLNQALQAYLSTPVQPAAAPAFAAGLGALETGSVFLRVRGAQAAPQGFDAAPLDWSGLHQQASARARDAVLTLDLPEAQPALSPAVSGLPFLLRRAISQGGEWTPGPGAPMPSSIRELALSAPFEAQPELAAPMAEQRPLNPGEDEIVIPLPLWAQMGRGRLSETDQIMASSTAPSGYAPRLGAYRLVVPEGGPVDLTGGAPEGAPGVIELTGPTSLELQTRSSRGPVVTSYPAGRRLIGRVPLAFPDAADDASAAPAVQPPQSSLPTAGPMELAAPATAAEAAADESGAVAQAQPPSLQPSSAAAPTSPSAAAMPRASVPSPGSAARPPPLASPNLNAPSAGTSSTLVSAPSAPAPAFPSNAPAAPSSAAAATPGGTFAEGTFRAAPTSMQVPALRSALQLSNDVAARTASPAAPAITAAPPQLSSSPAIIGDGSGLGSPGLPSVAGSDQALVSSPSIVSDASGGPIGRDTSTGSPVAPAGTATQIGQPAPSGGAQTFTGLAPGMWSGARPGAPNYQRWSYAPGRPSVTQTTAGGVSLSSLSRPVYPSLPTALRFRYAGAPLWWSASTPGLGTSIGQAQEEAPAARAMRSGIRAANSAAALWRSILVVNAGEAPRTIDASHDVAAGQMSSLSRNFDALSAASLVAAGATTAAAVSGPAYIAMNGQGAAGLTTGSAAARAKADAVEMRIVAAIPPSPPPLETMSSSVQGAAAPHSRATGAHAQSQGDKKDDSVVSASKIEGSVDAIAQRIYHRIRRRIQSDRERFGG